MNVPLEHALLLATAVFGIGLSCALIRRELLFVLLGVEIMLCAAGLALVAGSAAWRQPDGQVFWMLLLAIAAAEVAVGLSLLLHLHRRRRTGDVDELRSLRGE
ncbi:MAG: NADH-quinone oxidoreductase subunit NuoK [Myxococcales bacterium]|nr:NADH-quinone oxidoreductase subunit NuoK [Myxococcales bacterium]